MNHFKCIYFQNQKCLYTCDSTGAHYESESENSQNHEIIELYAQWSTAREILNSVHRLHLLTKQNVLLLCYTLYSLRIPSTKSK